MLSLKSNRFWVTKEAVNYKPNYCEQPLKVALINFWFLGETKFFTLCRMYDVKHKWWWFFSFFLILKQQITCNSDKAAANMLTSNGCLVSYIQSHLERSLIAGDQSRDTRNWVAIDKKCFETFQFSGFH